MPVDVTDAEFETRVVERSKEVPVVVDLWAPWCGPCRQLGPVLDNLEAEYNGKFELVKINIDENPQVATALRAQSIPLVIGIRDGQIVSQFVGAQPPQAIRQFLDEVIPSALEQLVVAAGNAIQADDLTTAAALLAEAEAIDPKHPAIVGLDVNKQVVLEEMVTSLRRQKDVVSARLQRSQRAMSELERRYGELPELAIQLGDLERDVNTQVELLLVLEEEYQQSQILESGEVREVSILQQALRPSSPINTSTPRTSAGIGAVLGMILGSFLYAIFSGNFRVEAFANRADMRNHLVAGVLMGFGGVLSFGCTIGQGVSGMSTLALGSLVALLSIMLGSALTMKIQYYMLDDGFWSSLRQSLADLRLLPSGK